MGPETGQPFDLNWVGGEFASAGVDDVDVIVTGFIGPNSTTIEQPLTMYTDVEKIGDDFEVHVYVKDYDKSLWGTKYIKIRGTFLYVP